MRPITFFSPKLPLCKSRAHRTHSRAHISINNAEWSSLYYSYSVLYIYIYIYGCTIVVLREKAAPAAFEDGKTTVYIHIYVCVCLIIYIYIYVIIYCTCVLIRPQPRWVVHIVYNIRVIRLQPIVVAGTPILFVAPPPHRHTHLPTRRHSNGPFSYFQTTTRTVPRIGSLVHVML